MLVPGRHRYVYQLSRWQSVFLPVHVPNSESFRARSVEVGDTKVVADGRIFRVHTESDQYPFFLVGFFFSGLVFIYLGRLGFAKSSSLASLSSGSRIEFLDYLRVFAFSSVLIGHKFIHYFEVAMYDTNTHIVLRIILKLLVPFVASGGAGVVVFFLVSGYIITHVARSQRPIEFAIKRVFRIYPLYCLAVLMEYSMGEQRVSVWVLLTQMTLLGDFFNTPYSLLGVEWTLRIEVLFYLYVGILGAFGVFSNLKILSMVLVSSIGGLYLLDPFPSGGWFFGYLTSHGVFLLLGALFYLAEQKVVRQGMLLIASTCALAVYLHTTELHHPLNLQHNFAIAGFLLFAVSWLARDFFRRSALVFVISEATYAVYLFHSWLFDFIRGFIIQILSNPLTADLAVLPFLFGWCFLVSALFEKPFCGVGKKISRAIYALSSLRSAHSDLSAKKSDQNVSGLSRVANL